MKEAQLDRAVDETDAAPRDVLEDVDRLIGELSAHSDRSVRENTAALLEGIDSVHRAALTHLMGAIQSMGGEAFVNRLSADPAIRLLLMSYDLLAVDRRLVAEEALDLVRGHLHAHSVDVELTEVAGSVVYVRLHGLERASVAPEAVARDLEAALRDGLPGFQELILRDRESSHSAGFVQLGGLRRAQRPVFQRVAASSDVPNGAMTPVAIDGQPILLINVNGDLFAVADRCGETPLPLRFGRLDGYVVHCSWHGCQYDVRTGRRVEPEIVNGNESRWERLTVFPVREQDGDVGVAVGVEPIPA